MSKYNKMKKILIAIFGCIALTGCDSKVGRVGKDGYVFGTPQYEKSRVVVNVVTYKTRAEFDKAFAERGQPISRNNVIMAFTVLRPMNNFENCTIHMIAPATKYEPEWIGHEFTHCVYGQWHTNNDTRS